MSTQVLIERSEDKDVVVPNGSTQAAAAVDLGKAYRKIIIEVTSAEAANLASGTFGLLIDDREYHTEDGSLLTIAKPAAGAGVHYVATVEGGGRSVNIVTSVTPTSDFTATVYGMDPLTADPQEAEFRKKWTI